VLEVEPISQHGDVHTESGWKWPWPCWKMYVILILKRRQVELIIGCLSFAIIIGVVWLQERTEIAYSKECCWTWVGTSILGGYSLSSVARTPRLMSYDILPTGDTTYSRRVSQIYERSYARSHVRNIMVAR